MNFKIFVCFCTVLIIFSTCADADSWDDALKLMEGMILKNHPDHPEQKCKKLLNDKNAYWAMYHDSDANCNEFLRCGVKGIDEMEWLPEKAINGVECKHRSFHTANRGFTCNNGKCEKI